MKFGARVGAVALLAVACSGSFTTPRRGTAPLTPPPPAPSATGVIVEASASGDHGTAQVPVWANDPRWGDWNAPVTIVEFGDLEDPLTPTVAATLEKLKEQYGPSKLRIVWKHLPRESHESARGAADAAVTVFALGGNDAFWKFMTRALEKQDDLDGESFTSWAEAAGVRRDAYLEAKGAERFVSKVEDDLELAQKLGIFSAPAFRINGVPLGRAATLSDLQKVIDGELDKAAKLVAAGARPADVYVTLTNQSIEAEPKKKRVVTDANRDDTVWQVPVLPDDPTLGPADALVTIVEFSDFQCPYCKRVLPTIEQLMNDYRGDVRLVWKDQPLPFHAAARPAAVLGRAAFDKLGNDGFWRAQRALFDSQPNLEQDDLERVANDLGLPWAPIQAAIEQFETGEQREAKKIWESVDLAADVEARGTPHFFLNGVRLSGAQPYDELEALFLRRREEALVLVNAGTPRDKVYAATIERGRKASVPERVDVAPPDRTTPIRGPAGAPVVIHEWSDFQCPFCERVQPTLRALEKEFAGRIQLVWHHNPLPFHKDAALASEAAQEVFAQRGAAAFWRFHDALFAAQSQPDGLARPNLEAIARRQGIDLVRFRQALDARTRQAKVESDVEAAKQAGVSGTPNFTINGYKLGGAQPIEAFRKLVKRALAERQAAKPKLKTKIAP